MTDKQTIRQQLSAYMDGELGDADAAAVERAVRADAELATELNELKATRRLLRDLPVERLGGGFAPRVLAQAERRRLVSGADAYPQRRAMGWVRRFAAAAAMLVVAGGLIGVVAALWLMPDFNDRVAVRDAAPEPSAPKKAPPGAVLAMKSGRATGAEEMDTGIVSKAGDKADETYAFGLAGKGGEAPDAIRGREADELTRAKPAAGPEGHEAWAKAHHRRAGDSDKELKDLGREAEEPVVATENVDIYTDDLAAAQLDVERVLLCNGIRPEATADVRARRAGLRQVVDGLALNRNKANRDSALQVQYVAVVTPEQARRVVRQLNEVKTRQVVSQDPVLPAAPAAPAGAGPIVRLVDTPSVDQTRVAKAMSEVAAPPPARKDDGDESATVATGGTPRGRLSDGACQVTAQATAAAAVESQPSQSRIAEQVDRRLGQQAPARQAEIAGRSATRPADQSTQVQTIVNGHWGDYYQAQQTRQQATQPARAFAAAQAASQPQRRRLALGLVINLNFRGASGLGGRPGGTASELTPKTSPAPE